MEDFSKEVANEAMQGSSCSCLQWDLVYQENLVQCGCLTCPELVGSDTREWGDDGLCAPPSWFKIQNHNFCVKFGKEKKSFPDPQQNWCYVNASCNNLNEGAVVNENVSAKFCGPGDKALDQMPPKALLAMESKTTPASDAQMTAIMAYDWQGPPENTGTLVGVPLNHPERPSVGASTKPDTFTVRWKNETWEVHNTFVCVSGCP